MERVLAQAMPTPSIVSSSMYLLCMNATDIKPTAPHSRQRVCVYFRAQMFWLSQGKANEKAKQTAE